MTDDTLVSSLSGIGRHLANCYSDCKVPNPEDWMLKKTSGKNAL